MRVARIKGAPRRSFVTRPIRSMAGTAPRAPSVALSLVLLCLLLVHQSRCACDEGSACQPDEDGTLPLLEYLLHSLLSDASRRLCSVLKSSMLLFPPPLHHTCTSRSPPMAASTERTAKRVLHPERYMEGAGFPVNAAIGSRQLSELDPFLLLHHMGPVKNGPGEAKGAPWHPHRGFVTVTYLLQGEFEHHDSTGASGVLRAGDIQWMTAGSGIIHDEVRAVITQSEGVTELLHAPCVASHLLISHRASGSLEGDDAEGRHARRLPAVG